MKRFDLAEISTRNILLLASFYTISNLDIKLNSHQLFSENVVVISYQLRLRDGTETSSTLRRWSSARRAVLSSELLWPLGVLCTQSETVELSA